MNESSVTSHFWVANPPFSTSTLLVATDELSQTTGRVATRMELFDCDGSKVNEATVEFPAGEVGVIEIEPYTQSLKEQGGVAHGHLAISSPAGTRHLCRQSLGGCVSVLPDPAVTKGRENAFTPLILGSRREHLVVIVNTTAEPTQVGVRLYYGNRAPEWNVDVPGNASRLISLESELLSTSDDASWEKGAVQAYIRIAPRLQGAVTCHLVERIPGETPEQATHRCLAVW